MSSKHLKKILARFNKAVSDCGGEDELIRKIIDPYIKLDDRKQSCWIDACPNDREEYEEVGDVAHRNDYCIDCAEKIVKQLLEKYHQLKDDIYINDNDVDADSSPSCSECDELITYSLVSSGFELEVFLYHSFDPTAGCDAYELDKLLDRIGCRDFPEGDLRKLALRRFYYKKQNSRGKNEL